MQNDMLRRRKVYLNDDAITKNTIDYIIEEEEYPTFNKECSIIKSDWKLSIIRSYLLKIDDKELSN
jgi:hypothetical protein